jgi:hypothetical protein
VHLSKCEDYLEVCIRPSFVYVCVCVCVCVFEVGESLCGYWAGESGCKKASVPILVKCNHTQIINKITSLCADQSDEKRRGDKLHRKGKREKGAKPRGLKSKGIFY